MSTVTQHQTPVTCILRWDNSCFHWHFLLCSCRCKDFPADATMFNCLNVAVIRGINVVTKLTLGLDLLRSTLSIGQIYKQVWPSKNMHGMGWQVKKKTARQKVREKSTKNETSTKVMSPHTLCWNILFSPELFRVISVCHNCPFSLKPWCWYGCRVMGTL